MAAELTPEVKGKIEREALSAVQQGLSWVEGLPYPLGDEEELHWSASFFLLGGKR